MDLAIQSGEDGSMPCGTAASGQSILFPVENTVLDTVAACGMRAFVSFGSGIAVLTEASVAAFFADSGVRPSEESSNVFCAPSMRWRNTSTSGRAASSAGFSPGAMSICGAGAGPAAGEILASTSAPGSLATGVA
jgi:hypothetical protein